MRKNNDLIIIGSTPEHAGIGGVSIHVDRLLHWFDKEAFKYRFCDYKCEKIKTQFKFIRESRLIHLHISKPLPRLIYVIYSKLVGTKSVMTVHGNVERYSGIDYIINRMVIFLCDVPILINRMSYDIASKWNKNAVLISAFLPPVNEGEIPEYVYSSINNAKSEGKIIVACNASAISYTDKGEEIYGVSFVIDFFKEKKEYFLCISDPSGQYKEKYKTESFDNILFIPEVHSFYKLMQFSDIMLRPTATDGDSLSVKEGLFLRKKVIATNRVDRPEGVMTFSYNDKDSLEIALKSDPLFNDFVINENVVDNLKRTYNELLNLN